MQFQQQSRTSTTMNQAVGGMYLPGMAPTPARIVLKPRTSWRDKNALTSEKPVEKKVEPYRSWRDNPKQASTGIAEKPVLKKVEQEKKETARANVPVDKSAHKPEEEPVAPPVDAEKSKKKKKKKSKSKESAASQYVAPKPRAASPPPVDHSGDERRIQELKDRLKAIQLEKEVEIKVIQEEVQRTKLEMRRSANKEEADTLNEQIECSKTAKMGQKLIKQLRKDNAKLRQSNDQLAKDIRELAHENVNLEGSIEIAENSKKVVEEHFQQIVAANEKLKKVEPQYAEKVAELQEALDVRIQYEQSERKVKILYAQLMGTLSEMMESRDSADQELTDEVLELVLDCNEEHALWVYDKHHSEVPGEAVERKED